MPERNAPYWANPDFPFNEKWGWVLKKEYVQKFGKKVLQGTQDRVIFTCDYSYSESCEGFTSVVAWGNQADTDWLTVDTDEGQKHMCPECHSFIFEEE